MSFKVVRNEQGKVIAFGPNEDWYEPAQGYVVEDVEPVIFTDTADAIRAEISRLEQSQLMPRATREFMLLSMQGMATPEQLAGNYGYQAVLAFDEQINALRAAL
jgi:hypothetical protein